MREEVQWWQEAGRRDLAIAERLLKARFYEGTAFHTQQAAEKFLKALLAKYRMELRTHSCAAMLKKLHKKLLVDKKFLTLARKLDVHYAAKELIAYAEKGLSTRD